MIQKWSLWRRLLECPPCKGRHNRTNEFRLGRSRLLYSLFIAGATSISPLPATAQLRPDDTLGNERSRISSGREIRGILSNQIDGGARRGENLFHSFRDFNVEDGRGVYFTNPRGVNNILTRVTGRDPSDIHGTLGVLGDANLFLLNPNGVLFGPNARLDLQGSFFTSTADRILFDNDFAFSATDPQAPPLLKISAPIGLQYGRNPGSILVQRAGLTVRTGETIALLGGDISIEGGALGLSGGSNLLAPGGHVELAGLAGVGEMELTQQRQEWWLRVPEELARADVLVSDGALVSVTAARGGHITIAARDFKVTEGSILQSRTEGAGDARSQGGDITIQAEDVTVQDSLIENAVALGGVGNAGDVIINVRSLVVTDSTVVSGTLSDRGLGGNLVVNAIDSVQVISGNGLLAQTLSDSNAGDLSINTRNLIVRDGAQVTAGTLNAGKGAGGNLTINATGSIRLISVDSEAPSGLFTQTENRGDAGDLTINTRSLIVREGAIVSSGTLSELGGALTEGSGGNLIVNAADSIRLNGTSADGQFPSLLTSDTSNRGDAGDLTINTGNLIIRNGAQVASGSRSEGAGGNLTVTANSVQVIGESANSPLASSLLTQTDSFGNAGNLTLEVDNLIIRDEAEVSSGTRGEGEGGNLIINASELIQVTGSSADGQSPSLLTATTQASGDAGDLIIRANRLIVGRNAEISSRQTEATATGDVGSISIESGSLVVRGRADITVEDSRTDVDFQDLEQAGNIDIQTDLLTLERGTISAETASTNGGNITLNVQNLLLMRNNGLISTNAGTAQAGGNGGNITFNGNFIMAVPSENSDISANAFTGSGGQVEINAQSVFGIQSRPQLTTLSDITASSEQGVAGVVTIDTPDVDPNRGLVQLPVDLVDASQLITQPCATGGSAANQANEFMVTGRGGLPPTPDEAITQDAVQVDLVSVATEEASSSQQNSEQGYSVSSPSAPIVEAAGWQVSDNGQVVLAAAPQDGTLPSLNRPLYCP